MDKNKNNQRDENVLIIFNDDNNETKEKIARITKDNLGVNIQLLEKETLKEIGTAFFLPWHRVLKIKELNRETKE